MSEQSSRKRLQILQQAAFNLNLIPANLVDIDLSTDSLMHFALPSKKAKGIGAIEKGQNQLSETIKEYFGYSFVVPVAQGRMAELMLAKVMVKNAMVVPSNMLFVTTHYHQVLNGASIEEIPVAEANGFESAFPFKGNMDIQKLEHLIERHGAFWIPYIYIETCVNASGGHPVSMQNIKAVHAMAQKHGIPVILDACRILENAYLIREREEGYRQKDLADIVKEFCSYSDGATMSATKDFPVDCGAFVAVNNKNLYYRLQDARMLIGHGLSLLNKAVLNDAMLQAQKSEKLTEDRVKKVEHLWKLLKDAGVPVLNPCGGHAVFIDSADLYQKLPGSSFPEEAFLNQCYIDCGLRAAGNILTPSQMQRGVSMLRLAIPIGMYSKIQLGVVAKTVATVWNNRNQLKGLIKKSQPPSLTGAFFAEFESQ